MKAYWCATCGRDGRNYGDRLGPILLAQLGVSVEWAPPPEAEIVTAGSVLSKFPSTWRGTVLGTGLIQSSMTAVLPKARILAVRGELTRDACGLPRSTPLGDPGILAPDLLDDPREAPVDGYTAIVPHYVDKVMVDRHPRARFIDILDEPADIVRAIAGASLVYTSSLHALITADALGVPHVLELANTIGGLHKFRDYASAFGEWLEPETIRLTDRASMAERQRELRRLFAEVVAEQAPHEPRAGRKAVTGAERARRALVARPRRGGTIRARS